MSSKRRDVRYKDYITKQGLAKLRKLSSHGYTDRKIAEIIGIHYTTLSNWRKEHPVIDEALRNGRHEATIEVEDALFKAATGYEYEEDGVVNGEVQRMVKYAKPDMKAALFWLKNRSEGHWTDKQEFKVETEESPFSSLSEEQLKAIANALMQDDD